MEIFLIKDNAKIALGFTPKEFLILNLFIQNNGILFSREKIIKSVWGEITNITDRTIDQHIAHIRKKISKSLISIDSIRGEGYLITNT